MGSNKNVAMLHLKRTQVLTTYFMGQISKTRKTCQFCICLILETKSKQGSYCLTLNQIFKSLLPQEY